MKYVVNSFFVKTGTTKNMIGLHSPAPNAPDLDALNAELAKVCNDMDAAGYEPVHFVPLQIGSGGGNSPGWSVTRGAAVVGRRRES